MQQLPNLTSLRFILAVLVILFHIPGFFLKRGITSSFDFSIFLNGNESVWLFFSLSGFLIIKQLNDEKKSTNTINLIRFLKKRILRIFPLYYLILIYGLIHYHVIRPKLGFESDFSYDISEAILLNFTFFSNIFRVNSPGIVLEILWSIGIEEQFYILIAPLFFLLPKSKIKTTLISITIAYLLLFTSTIFPFLKEYRMYFFFFTFSGLCAIYLEKTNFNKLFSYPIYFVTLTYFLSNCFKNNLNENQYLIFSMILFGLFLTVLSKKSIPLLENSILKYLGTISYGIYMFHAIAMQIIGYVFIKLNLQLQISKVFHIISYTFLVMVLTIIMAHFSYKYYESFFLKFKKST